MNFRAAFGTTLLLGCGLSAQAATYQSTILGNAGPNGYSLDDFGNVAYFTTRNTPSGNAFTYVASIEVRDVSGNSEFTGATNGFVTGIGDFRDPIILDDGSFVATRGLQIFDANSPYVGFTGAQLVRVIPNGSTIETSVGPVQGFDLIVLAEQAAGLASPRGLHNDFKEFLGSAVNSSGEVAAKVRTLDGETKIVKIAADGSSFVEIATEDASAFSFTAPDINDNGEVSWIAQIPTETDGTTRSVFVGTGAQAPERRLDIQPNGGSGLGPDINNDGTVVGYQPSVIALNGPGEDANSPSNIIVDDSEISGFVNYLGLNDFGQVAYADASGVYIDGELVIAMGAELPGGAGNVSAFFIRDNVSFNNNGQLVAEVRTQERNENGTVLSFNAYTVRFDPDGATPHNPLMPFSSTPDGQNDVALNIANGLGVNAPIWVDPIVATGFTYSMGIGGENFASVIIPDALPLGDDSFVLEFSYGISDFFSGIFGIGTLFDFTTYDTLGVSEFTIKGIDIGEAVDPTDPFVVGLTFVSGGFQSTLSIDAITFDTDATDPPAIPLPASVPMLLGALGALGWVGRRKIHTAT